MRTILVSESQEVLAEMDGHPKNGEGIKIRHKAKYNPETSLQGVLSSSDHVVWGRSWLIDTDGSTTLICQTRKTN